MHSLLNCFPKVAGSRVEVDDVEILWKSRRKFTPKASIAYSTISGLAALRAKAADADTATAEQPQGTNGHEILYGRTKSETRHVSNTRTFVEYSQQS